MATYKLILNNPYRKSTNFHVKVNNQIVRIPLKAFETKDLTTINSGFTINAGSTNDVTIGKKISDKFMSDRGTLEILMRDSVRHYDKLVKINNRPYSDFFTLET